jgi:hypothetical protein
MIEDFEKGTMPADATHIHDFVWNVDWETYSPNTPAEQVPEEKSRLEQVYMAAVNAGQEINIHFHVFDPDNIYKLIEYLKTYGPLRLRWDVVEKQERFPDENPNGVLLVIQARKTFGDSVAGLVERIRHGLSKNPPLRELGKAFDN